MVVRQNFFFVDSSNINIEVVNIYTEVDATNTDYKKFAEVVMRVKTAELAHAPSMLIMEYEQGVWINGPEAVFRIASSLIYII